MQNRPLRPFEQAAHLHVLDWAHHTARARLQAAGAVQVKAAAKAVVKTPGRLQLPSLAAAVHSELVSLYAVGHATVRSELDHQATGEPMPIGLSQAPTLLDWHFDPDQPRDEDGEWSGGGGASSLDAVQAAHPGVEMHASESKAGIVLSMIRTPTDKQGQGLATKALRDLLAYADKKGLTVALTPDRVGKGASKAALTKWYASHGFVPNKGKHKDFAFTQTHLRPPQGSQQLSQPITLAVADPAKDSDTLLHRARLTAAAVAHHISDAVHRGRLQGITDGKTLRALGRDAGNAALGQAASHHAGGTINAGRHAAAQAAIANGGRTGEIIGARYTSVLDKNSCPACVAADDGVLRSLADPGLIHPPNPNCAGGDRCRCILVYQLSNEITSTA